MSRLVLRAALVALGACSPAREPLLRAPSVSHASVEDRCADLPTPVAPSPPLASISLDLLTDEARQLESVEPTTKPLQLGMVKPPVRIGRSTFSGNRMPLVAMTPPRFPRAQVEALLPAEVLPLLRRQDDARVALSSLVALRDPSARVAACLDASREELERADRALRETLTPRREPLADLLVAELALAESSVSDDPHAAALLLAEAITRATRARDATRPDELVGFFARALRAQALQIAGDRDGALEEATALIGVTPPDPSVRGEAELRMAELEPDSTKQPALYLAAVAAAPDNPMLRFAGRSGAILSLYGEEEPARALRLTGELLADPPPELTVEVDDFAAHAYAVLLPLFPAWWNEELPRLSPRGVQIVAADLANESDRRGDHRLARGLRMRAFSLGEQGPETAALRRSLREAELPPDNVFEEARARVTQLYNECTLEPSESPRHANVEIATDRQGLRISAHPDDKTFSDCLRHWGPGFLLGLPPLRATMVR